MTDAAQFLNSELMRLKGNPPIIGGIVLQHIVGSGGMGLVFHGTHLRLRIPVAVKFLFDDPSNKDNVSRFISEAALSARINSPFVVRVYDVNKDGPFQYIVQEYIEGETADRRLCDSVLINKPMGEFEVLNIAADAARGLAAIHAINHLHLDIKPANLMISTKENTTKIVDFGLAQRFDPKDIPGSVPSKGKYSAEGGTPGYSSPEQLNFLTVGASSDIYSLGVSLFELLAGRRGFDVDGWDDARVIQTEHELPYLLALRPELNPETANLVAKCVRINPTERYQSAMELLSAIASASQPSSSKRTQSVPPYTTPSKRKRAPTATPEISIEQKGPLIYCVDDQVSILNLLSEILSDDGCRVEIFTEGSQALYRMRAQAPDLVFLDFEMPTMSGLDICTAMRSNERLRSVPIVFLTGNTSMQSLQAALREGATDYLVKPVHAAEVVARVQCLTRMSRAQNELTKLQAVFDGFQNRLSTLTGRKLP